MIMFDFIELCCGFEEVVEKDYFASMDFLGFIWLGQWVLEEVVE